MGQDTYGWFCLAFCHHGPVLSRRKRHNDSSCQAAYLYSCEGHIRRHGTWQKSEISLVTSHPHCALPSTRELLGIVLSMWRIRTSASKGKNWKNLASYWFSRLPECQSNQTLSQHGGELFCHQSVSNSQWMWVVIGEGVIWTRHIKYMLFTFQCSQTLEVSVNVRNEVYIKNFFYKLHHRTADL